MIAITGASGHLGTLVVDGLLAKVPAGEFVAAVRNLEKGSILEKRGVRLREANYDRPETLVRAFQDVERVLLISATEQGTRIRQHRNVITAAKQAGVKTIAYTSLLHADRSDLMMAADHRATEKDLSDSGLETIVLRNGWYLENHTRTLPAAIQKGAILGSAGEGRFASASRADYAGAAVAVLTQRGHENKIYELAGDTAFSLQELAAEVTRQAGVAVTYQNLPPEEYKSALQEAGLQGAVADLVVDCDLKAQAGALEDTSHALSRLLGRPTTSLVDAVAHMLA